MAISKKVFVVHGHDRGAKHEVARFVNEQTAFEAEILDEKPSRGRTLIDKFEDYAAEAWFAVVLLTPDDVGCKRGDETEENGLEPRARQNVIFELGYFRAKLGRGAVCALTTGGVELPSDFVGLEWVRLDSHGGWKARLKTELEAEWRERQTRQATPGRKPDSAASAAGPPTSVPPEELPPLRIWGSARYYFGPFSTPGTREPQTVSIERSVVDLMAELGSNLLDYRHEEAIGEMLSTCLSDAQNRERSAVDGRSPVRWEARVTDRSIESFCRSLVDAGLMEIRVPTMGLPLAGPRYSYRLTEEGERHFHRLSARPPSLTGLEPPPGS